METAKVIKIGGEQMIVLPQDCHMDDDEVYIRRVGSMITAVPMSKIDDIIVEALAGFTDDFMPNGREPEIPSQRAEL